MAKFEVCGHKWMDVSQADKGVTLITDSKYGYHARDNMVHLSLLRSPKNPDAECDMHRHFIHYAVLPHTGTFQEANVIRRAYELNYLHANNVPFIPTDLTAADLSASLLTIDEPAVVVSAIKTATKLYAEKAYVVRLYESFGGTFTARINLGFTAKAVHVCNGLEDPGESVQLVGGNSFTADFSPFQIRSFLIHF